jgi:hypothetical protein
MIVAEITQDKLYDPKDTVPSRVGFKFSLGEVNNSLWTGEVELPLTPKKIQFRLKDDDGEIYYEGWLFNDEECLVQEFLVNWAERDSGCTDIEVKLNNKWTQEIG